MARGLNWYPYPGLGRSVDDSQEKSSAVAIGPRIVASGGFDSLYREGMALIEDVASYLDGDGRVDVVVSALGSPAELWWNQSAGAGHWLALRLAGTKGNRDGMGAVVKVTASADPRWRQQWNTMTTAVGYAYSSAGPVHFGTGAAAVVNVEIRWPSGAGQTLTDVKTGQVLVVTEPR